MVNVRSKRCLHDGCKIRPSFNVKGSRTKLFCKNHAEDGMFHVRSKRCSYDSCSRSASFTLEGTKTPMYCERHAEDGMVDVRNKGCMYDGCNKHPRFIIKGSRTKLYCKAHAENGAVEVNKEHVGNESRAKRSPKALLSRAGVSTSTGPYHDVSDECVVSGRKRSRLAVDRNMALLCPDGPSIQGEVVQYVRRTPSDFVPLARPPSSTDRHRNDTLVPPAVKGTRHDIPVSFRPVTKDEASVSTEPIKIELGLTLKL